MESKEKSPSPQYTFNHTIASGKFNKKESEKILENFITLGVNIDFKNEYGLSLDTGPSDRGGREYRAKFTKEIY